MIKRYRMFTREEGGEAVLATLFAYLTKEQGLYHDTILIRRTGGRSGDMVVENREYHEFIFGSEGGLNRGGVAVYAVLDDSVNGYALSVSALIDLPIDEQGKEVGIAAHLDALDFVSSYRSFRVRPVGFKHFRDFLDEWPVCDKLDEPFLHQGRRQRQAA